MLVYALVNSTAGIKWLQSGATWRGTDSHPENSCQYKSARYMDSLTSPYIIGVGAWWWRKSVACGQCLLLRAGNRVAVGVVGDYCPPPCTPRQLDLNPALSKALSPTNRTQNYATLEVAYVPCGYKPNVDPYLHMHRDSNPWVMYIQVLFTKHPVLEFSFGGVPGYHDAFGRWVLEMHDLQWRAQGYTVRMMQTDGKMDVFKVMIN